MKHLAKAVKVLSQGRKEARRSSVPTRQATRRLPGSKMDPRFREDDEAGSGKQKARFWRALGSLGPVLAAGRGMPGQLPGMERQGSVTEHFLLELTALLRFEGQAGGRPGDQPSDANGFAGFVAVTVVTGIDAGN